MLSQDLSFSSLSAEFEQMLDEELFEEQFPDWYDCLV